MEEQNQNGVGSSCPVCDAPVAPEEMASHAQSHEGPVDHGQSGETAGNPVSPESPDGGATGSEENPGQEPPVSPLSPGV